VRSTHYTILDVSPKAELDEIYIAHHKAVAALKHGVTMGDPEAQAQQRLVDLAYESLSDPAKRAEYDMSIAAEQTQMMKHVDVEEAPNHPVRRVVLLALLLVAVGNFWQEKTAEWKARDEALAAQRRAHDAAVAEKKKEAANQPAAAPAPVPAKSQ
jgi:curved DNA-binding protein CbpA